MCDTRFDNIRIMRSWLTRGNLRHESKHWVLGGFACDDGEGSIYLGKVGLGHDDYVQPMTMAELITHETIHHLMRRFKGQNASEGFDSMTLERSYLDSYRIYIQKTKIHTI